MRFATSAIAGFMLLATSLNAPAGAIPIDLITNGGFEQTTIASGAPFYGSSQITTTNVVGWSSGTTGSYSGGYNFLFAASATSASGTTADTTGANNLEYNSTLKLWGPGDGSTNGLSTSPTGGNFVGADGAYQTGPITQTVNGLVAGHSYALTFNWAGAQQQGFTGPNSEGWLVSFGTDSFDTGYAANTSEGFTGWRSSTAIFTAQGPSQALSFLAKGLPSGVPPFALLDSVTMFAVPEPASWALMIVGLMALGGMVRLHRLAATGHALDENNG